MKNIIVDLLLLTMLLLVNSCTDLKEDVNDKIIIKGQIADSPYNKISLQYDDELLFSVIDPQGLYEFEITSENPLYMRLQLGELGIPLYSEPGKVDSISCLRGFAESRSIEGDNAVINDYLLSKIHKYDELNSKLNEYYRLEANSFTKKLDSVLTHFQTELNELINNGQSISSSFIFLENAQILYKWASLRQSYPRGHKYFTGIDKVELPSNYDDYLLKLDLNNPALLLAPEYVSFLHSFLINELSKKTLNSTTGETDINAEKLKLIPHLFTNPQIQDELLIDIMRKVFRQNKTENIPELVSLHNSLCNSHKNKEIVSKLFESWRGLSKGSPAPQFVYSDINGNKVSLNDYMGKNICLDIWATWCLPCKKEFPLIKEMIKKYETENIVFIGISVDDNEGTWIESVKENQLEGVQLFADNGWESSVIDDYNIHTIPRFILIDTEGKIIDANAKFPSKGLNEQIKELLK